MDSPACSGDFEISFEDASPTCGMACLVGGCVCGIPYYSPSLTLTSHTFSPRHTLTGWPPVLLLLACASPCSGQKAHMLFTHPGPDAKTSAAHRVSGQNIFKAGCTHSHSAGREGDETQLGSCVDCQRTNGPQTSLIPMDAQ